MRLLALLLLLLLGGLHTSPASAATIWTGPDRVVSQPAGAPLTVTDVVVPGVASLTRGETGLLCNLLAPGDGCIGFGFGNPLSPLDFEFAFSGLNGNAVFGYGSAATLSSSVTFAELKAAAEDKPGFVFPRDDNSLGPVPGIAHLVSQDIFFDIEMQFWGRTTGAFTYRRSTVPEPATAILLTIGLTGLALRGRRPRS